MKLDSPVLALPRILPVVIGLFLALDAASAVTVFNTDDSGPGSLRQAILDASSGGTIDFDPALDGLTIAMFPPQILIEKNVAIESSGLPNGLTISGSDLTRIFKIIPGCSLSLDSLTLSDGRETGSEGGAVLNEGTLTLDRCTVSDSTAANGGAIANEGTVLITNSTISGNAALGGKGGGIYNIQGSVTIHSSTITGNTALSGNGSGVASKTNPGTETTVGNSIIAGNSNSSDIDLDGGGANPFTTMGHNLIGFGTATGAFTGTGDTIMVVDPMLGPLADNGGPTPTHEPLAGSPAIDTGSTPEGYDQRGKTRFKGSGADRGAVEVGVEIVVNTSDDENDGMGMGMVSLRDAIADAPDGATIVFDSFAFYDGPQDEITLDPAHGEIAFTKDFTINANAIPGGVVVSGDNASRIFNVPVGRAVTLRKLTLTDGHAPDGTPGVAGETGGAILCSGGTVILVGCTLTNNRAGDGPDGPEFGGSGGAIGGSGTIGLLNCTLENNRAGDTPATGFSFAGSGGAISIDTGFLTLISCTLHGNSAGEATVGTTALDGSGGALMIRTGFVAANCTFTANRADNGGAIFIVVPGGLSPSLDLIQSTVVGNTATNRAGGFYLSSGALDLQNCIVAENTATAEGPDIYKTVLGTINNEDRVNLIGVNQTVETVFPADGTLVGTTAVPVAAKLHDLCNNGGLTQTMHPHLSSPALDASTDTPFTLDQRGVGRPGGSGTDLGAVEAYFSLVVDTDEDLDGANLDPGTISLRKAVAYSEPQSTVTFAVPLDGGTLGLELGEIVILQDVTIDASALPAGFKVSGGDTSRLFAVEENVTATIENLTLCDGHPRGSSNLSRRRGDGGAIWNTGDLTLRDCILENNRAADGYPQTFPNSTQYATGYSGGAIWNDQSLALFDCILRNNRTGVSSGASAGDGGAVFTLGGTMALTRCLLTDNVTSGVGGFGGALASFIGLDSAHPNVLASQCEFARNHGSDGGAILCSLSSVIIDGCTFHANGAVGSGFDGDGNGGGALRCQSTDMVEVTNSTFLKNHGFRGGGAILFNSFGSSLILNHCTIVGNSTGDVFSGSGGGVLIGQGALSVTAGVIAGNTSSTGIGADVAKENGTTVTFNGPTLLGDNHTVELEAPADGILVGTAAAPIDPLLAPLGLHGGDTPVMVPYPGSPALDAVGDTGIAVDQRGTLRPQQANHDLGAVEFDPAEVILSPSDLATNVGTSPGLFWTYQPGADTYEVFFGTIPGSLPSLGTTSTGFMDLPVLGFGTAWFWRIEASTGGSTISSPEYRFTTGDDLIVTTATDVVDSGDGLLSLREALAAAAARTGPDTIGFAGSLNGSIIQLRKAFGQLRIDDCELTIDATSLPNGISIDGDGKSRVMRIESGNKVTILGVNFFGGRPEDAPAALAAGLANFGITAISEATFSLNSGSTLGGAIFTDGSLTLTNAAVSNNSGNFGGGVYSTGDLTVTDCAVSDNEAFAPGSGSSLGGSGGGIHSSRSTGNALLMVTRTTIHGNHADTRGGGILVHGRMFRIEDSTLSGNSSGDNGGGFYGSTFLGDLASIVNSTIVDNSAAGNGGGVYWFNGSLELTHCTITGNTAPPDRGSGLSLDDSLFLDAIVHNSIIAENINSDVDVENMAPPDDIVSLGHNLIGTGGGVPAFTGPGDITGVGALLLTPLDDNGGPTRTRVPLPGSIAIDQAGATTVSTDQRGAPRPTGGIPDIGAVEQYCLPSGRRFFDSDRDGMDDFLETAYGFVVGVMDGHLDADGDGSTNAEELSNKTDPFDGSDYLRILSFAPAPGFIPVTNQLFDITWSSFPGLVYELEAEPDLDPANFHLIPGSEVTATDFTESRQVFLGPSRDFVRVRRK